MENPLSREHRFADGESLSLYFRTAINLTGHSFRMELKDAKGVTKLSKNGSVSSFDDNGETKYLVNISVSAEEIGALQEGNYFFNIFWTDAVNKTRLFEQSRLIKL